MYLWNVYSVSYKNKIDAIPTIISSSSQSVLAIIPFHTKKIIFCPLSLQYFSQKESWNNLEEWMKTKTQKLPNRVFLTKLTLLFNQPISEFQLSHWSKLISYAPYSLTAPMRLFTRNAQSTVPNPALHPSNFCKERRCRRRGMSVSSSSSCFPQVERQLLNGLSWNFHWR